MELEEIEKLKQANAIVTTTKEDLVDNAILQKAQETTNVKDVIDLASTSAAVKQNDTIEKLTQQKTDELVNDAVAKRVKSETDRINEEVKQVKALAEKEIAEYEKSIENKKKEYEELVAQDKKAEAYFNAHKPILRCVGVREKLSIKAMQWWLVPASILYGVFQLVLLPFTIIGFAIEQLLNIVNSVCGNISKNGWKIALSIILIVLILGVVVGTYILATKFVGNVF